jgi:hypothetical protein
VAPHWLAALGATVNPLTDCTQGGVAEVVGIRLA